MSGRTSAIHLLVLGAVVLGAHLSLVPRVAAVDSFYHMGHAAEYLARGLFDTSFPWATQSVIRDLGADQWWGFHVLLVPFTLFGDPAIGIRLAALAFTAVLAATVLFVLLRHSVPHAGWWTVLFLVAVPNVLYRYLMVRPHVLSLALALVLASLLVRGRWWQVVMVTTAMVWIHLSLFWMAPGVAVAYAIVRLARGRRPDLAGAVGPVSAAVAVACGTVLGALLRPHPLASAELAYIQIVRLLAVKASELPVNFAVELDPLPLAELGRTSWLFLAAWVGAVMVTVKLALRRSPSSMPSGSEDRSVLLPLTVLISMAFGALTVLSARRALVEFVAFGCLAIPLAWTSLGSQARRWATLALGALLVVHVPWGARRHGLNAELVAFAPDAMSDVASWLALNSAPEEVVFHARWDNFGPLFARNRANRYLGGMDPIFQYAHDAGRFWEHFYLSADVTTEYTCDAFPCYQGNATGTHEAIRSHFGASWVLVEPRRNPKLTEFLLAHPGFELRLQTARERVFRVLPLVEPPLSPDPGP